MIVAIATVAMAHPEREIARHDTVVLEDFQSYQAGGLPTRWEFIGRARTVEPVSPSLMTEDQYFVVRSEGGRKFLRAYTRGRAHRLVLTNKNTYHWNVLDHPYLQWDWRALELPEGAREDRDELNDSGAALYVIFSQDWLGRPRSIKYSYSSTLPVGSVASYGPLKVLVVSSGVDEIGEWKTMKRNVLEDYRSLFGGTPPSEPISIMVWSDSNTTHTTSRADFDNIRLLPAR